MLLLYKTVRLQFKGEFQEHGCNLLSNLLTPCSRLSFVFVFFVSGDLAKSIRNRTDLHFGLYHSLFEWYNPLFLQDKQNNFSTNRFVEVTTFILTYFNLFVWYSCYNIVKPLFHSNLSHINLTKSNHIKSYF